MQMEREWTSHPVVRLDMSSAGAEPESIRAYLDDAFHQYEKKYNVEVRQLTSLAVRLKNIIATAYENTGQRVAVLVDEYDSPLQHSWHSPHHEACTNIYREVFAVLKMMDAQLYFVFITGITKFTQISLFSVLNNLSNISFDQQYATICGITDKEIKENFMPEIELMAETGNWTIDETMDKLKGYYDGYHFCAENMVDIYNPFSLINALCDRRLRNYWAASGATSLISKFVDDFEIRLADFEKCEIMRNTLETSDVTGGGPELFLYQSGYLTIKSCDEFGYILGIPNTEVRQALNEMVLPALTMRKEGD